MMFRNNKEERILQGDILKKIEYIEYAEEENGVIEVSKIVFPYVIVLTQDCDLQQDFSNRKEKKANQKLLSVIVAPLYNVEQFKKGEHLNELGREMKPINWKSSEGNNIEKNETPRYHYIKFPDDIDVPESVIDFKHYFTINVESMLKNRDSYYCCSVKVLFRERISQRFSNYLSRIGLP